MRRLVLFIALLAPSPLLAQVVTHPLDGLATTEYWTVYDALQSAGHLTPETKFTSVLLRPPAKATVLAWKPGQPPPREADIVLLRARARPIRPASISRPSASSSSAS